MAYYRAGNSGLTRALKKLRAGRKKYSEMVETEKLIQNHMYRKGKRAVLFAFKKAKQAAFRKKTRRITRRRFY